ncbi:MAG: aldo/keto reductase [Fidelibacterota bacterium]|nr:MAG: aldo/keto reductase [Candidatus Neomarinimicrobiota bacterium]
MGKKTLTRKDFIKISSATAVALTVAPKYLYPLPDKQLDPKGLPTRQLGKTGISVPIIGMGCGSRFLTIESVEESDRVLNYAIDHGLYYWDTAANYEADGKISEERLGRVLKHRRKEVWLSTKVGERDGEAAKVQIERSLKRLQTDHLDELKIHSVQSPEDAAEIRKEGNVLTVLRNLKEQGVVKHIGFSGHYSTEAMMTLAEVDEFDTMLIALNHYREGAQIFETTAVPKAAKEGLGVLVMKVIRPRETVKDIAVEDLIRYALSLKHVHCAVIGMDSVDIMKKNIALIKDFKPLNKARMEEIKFTLEPFYNHEGVEWMQPHYRDGMWA